MQGPDSECPDVAAELFSSPASSFDPLSFPNHRFFVCAPALFAQASHNPRPLVNQVSKPLFGGSRLSAQHCPLAATPLGPCLGADSSLLQL